MSLNRGGFQQEVSLKSGAGFRWGPSLNDGRGPDNQARPAPPRSYSVGTASTASPSPGRISPGAVSGRISSS